MTILILLAALTVILATGFGVTRGLLRDAESLWWPEFIGLAWIVGSGVLSVFLWLGGFVARGTALVALVACAALAMSFWLGRAVRSAPRLAWFPRGTAVWEKVFTALLLLPLGAFAVQAFRETLHWDGILVWEIKARIAFLHGGALPLSYYSTALVQDWSHPGYPLYLPMQELWVYLWLGEANQHWVKAIFPLFQLAALSVLWSAGLRLTGRVWCGALAAWLLFFIPRAVEARAGLLQGYADLLLGVIYLGAVAAVLPGKDGERAWLRAAMCMSALLPWVKQEGLVLWACYALVAGWVWRRDWRIVVKLLLPGFVTIVGWRLFLAAVDLPKPATFVPLTLETLQANLPRVPALLRRLGEELVFMRRWTLLWPLVGLAIAILFLQRRRAAMPLLLAVAVPLLVYLVPYVFTALQPYEMHVETSIDRLVLQIVPVAVLTLVLVFADPDAADRNTAARAFPPGRRAGRSGFDV